MTAPTPAVTVTHTFRPSEPQSDVCRCGVPAEPHDPVHERTDDEE